VCLKKMQHLLPKFWNEFMILHDVTTWKKVTFTLQVNLADDGYVLAHTYTYMSHVLVCVAF
jgi:hypothetical protein